MLAAEDGCEFFGGVSVGARHEGWRVAATYEAGDGAGGDAGVVDGGFAELDGWIERDAGLGRHLLAAS